MCDTLTYRQKLLVLITCPCLFLLTACSADQPLNPSFALPLDAAQQDLKRMRQSPTTLSRPVVILGGWIDPGFATGGIAKQLSKAFDDERVVTVSFAFADDFNDCRERALRTVDEAFGRDADGRPMAVDVIAVSMGGIVARDAAIIRDDEPDRYLRIARLFTIATPHRGAAMATFPTLDCEQIAMRPGSPFLRRLDAALATALYPIMPYVRLDDMVVGPPNAAPPDRVAWWVANRPCDLAHTTAYRDPRILADILRRLRNEPPFSTLPATPLPDRPDG